MKRLACFATLAALAMSCNALARGGVADVIIIDRDSGAALAAYYHRGEYWVAGRPGARYAIQIRNCTGGRLLAVTSVDGVNVVSGASAGWGQAGYVFNPGARYQITGWRKSNSEVADFTFADAADSYAERTGRPANVGVIGVALFRESEPQTVYVPPRITLRESVVSEGESRALAGQSPAATAAPSAAPWAGRAGGLAADQAQAPARWYTPPMPAAKLGTGHGEREYSYVVDTEFQRMRPEPDQVIRIRYDSFENLVAMGIVRRPRPTPLTPNPFPGSQQREFVPDPPG
ncbi:MAG: hypothetical protein ACRETP_10875 [Steroidobacteraceae bacterium]